MRSPTRSTCLSVLVVTIALAAHARAAITATWHPVTISAAAVADDPVLANMQSWDLRVTTDGNWASAGLRLTLPAGHTFYKHALGSNTKPNQTFLPIARGLEFTTYVTAPADTGAEGAPSVLGGFPEGTQTSIGDSTSALPGVFSVSWGDLVNDPPGNYQIARVTFPQVTLPETHNLSNTSQVNPDSTTSLFRIPEPAAALSIASMGLLLGARRRR